MGVTGATVTANCVCVCVCVCVHAFMHGQSCSTLRDLMNSSPPGPSVHGIFLTRVLEWVAISSSRGSSQPGDPIHGSALAGRFFTTLPPEFPGPTQNSTYSWSESVALKHRGLVLTVVSLL